VSKNLIIEVKVSFALDQDGTGSRVEIIQRVDEPKAKGLLKPKKGGGRNRDTYSL
jgi:hypothetical protein